MVYAVQIHKVGPSWHFPNPLMMFWSEVRITDYLRVQYGSSMGWKSIPKVFNQNTFSSFSVDRRNSWGFGSTHRIRIGISSKTRETGPKRNSSKLWDVVRCYEILEVWHQDLILRLRCWNFASAVLQQPTRPMTTPNNPGPTACRKLNLTKQSSKPLYHSMEYWLVYRESPIGVL